MMMNINLGPQHPPTHGVPRCISILHGEIIQYIITEIGLLHRGTEKLIAINSNPTNISYSDRSDHIPIITQEPLFLQTLEISVGCNITLLVPLRRTLLVESYRNLNHVPNITTHAIDIGLFTTTV